MQFLKIWFFSHSSIAKTVEVARLAEENNFDYFLLPFKIGCPDPISKSIYVMTHTNKINGIAAFPGYAATPVYISMINNSIKEMFPEREFLLNIIDGGILEDPSVFGINKNKDDVKSINESFSKKLLEISDIKLVFSGKSDSTYDKVKKYGKLQLSLFEDFDLIPKERYSTLVLRVFICLKETDEEAKRYFDAQIKSYINDFSFNPILVDRIRKNTLVGSVQTIKNKIEELREIGLAGVLVSDLVNSNTEEEVIRALNY